MAKPTKYTPYKPQTQKTGGGFKRFMRKSMLMATFAGAVSATGYNYYGTQEEITATIRSVETVPATEAGKAPEMKVYTDRGVFTNDKTFMYLKGNSDTIQLGNKLQEGATVKLKVYGYNPQIGSLSLDDFGFHRNILDAEVLKAGAAKPEPATPQPAGQAQPAPVANAGAQAGFKLPLITPDVSDTAKARTCADNANLADIQGAAPQLARDMAIMERLPITGKPVFDMIANPANSVRSCLIPESESGEAGSNQNHSVKVKRGAASGTSFHEYFHAMQDIVNKGDEFGAKLTVSDAAVSNALLEAVAVGYQLAARKEAENRGLSFTDTATKTVKTGMGTMTSRTISAADDEGTKAVFSDAYDRSFQQNATLDAKSRETKALEAGGQAVVRALMFGDDNTWLQSYAQLIRANVNNNSHIYSRNSRDDAGYAQNRDAAFKATGALGNMNFVPAEFIGANADNMVARCMRIMGLNVETAQASRPATPRFG